MKKNIMMRAASALLVAVLLTTCSISGTYAKYVTAATSEDTARVAKWGVEVSTKSSAFSKTYETDDTSVKASIQNSVSATEEVVAPGTEGQLANVELKGTPEVAVRVSYDAKLELYNWEIEKEVSTTSDDADSTDTTEEYFPIIFTIGTKDNVQTYGMEYVKAEGNVPNNKYSTIEELIKGVQTAISNYKKEYAPNQNLSNTGEDGLIIKWKWFYQQTESDGTIINDDKDTKLGNKAANSALVTAGDDSNDNEYTPTDNAPRIYLRLTTTVTQID